MGIASSHARIYPATLVALPVAVLGLATLGWITLVNVFGPDVRRVDPAVLSELRAIGRVVGEETSTGHEWENVYVEMNSLVIYFHGGAKGDAVTEAARRLKQSGWYVSRRQSPEIWLESRRWPSVLDSIEPLEVTSLSRDLRRKVATTGLPMGKMAYMDVLP